MHILCRIGIHKNEEHYLGEGKAYLGTLFGGQFEADVSAYKCVCKRCKSVIGMLKQLDGTKHYVSLHILLSRLKENNKV